MKVITKQESTVMEQLYNVDVNVLDTSDTFFNVNNLIKDK
jgi:hypothetical protein